MAATAPTPDSRTRVRTIAVALLAVFLVALADVDVVVGSNDRAIDRAPSATARTDAEVVPTSLAPHVRLHGATTDDAAHVDEAVARFVDAGMALPDLQVSFHADETDCEGHLGLFRRSTTPWSIKICSDLAFVATHELAHAWIAAHVTPSTRQAVLATTGLRHWRGADVPWDERGVERAAFVVQQVLMADGRPRRASLAWQDRLALFALLTEPAGAAPGTGAVQPLTGR